MADYFSKHAPTVCECLSNLDAETALELGSGNGFLSVCFLASLQQQQSKRMKELVITDLQEHLPLIRRTLNANRHIHFVLGADDDGISRGTLTTSAAEESEMTYMHHWCNRFYIFLTLVQLYFLVRL